MKRSSPTRPSTAARLRLAQAWQGGRITTREFRLRCLAVAFTSRPIETPHA